MTIVSNILVCIGVYLSLYVAYWLLLLLTHFLSVTPIARPYRAATKFLIIVPAHNEELLLPRLLDSVRQQDYPRELFTSIVVADNCSDDTTKVAGENGAIVLERSDETNKGKGYAIKWALERVNTDDYDAVFVIDADSVMIHETLRHLDGVIQGGNRVIQCYNGVGNPEDSWFTRLLDVSRTIGNEIYHPAKQRLGLSSYLMGNGMCFTTAILRKYGWDAFTVGEDWEYYAKLVQNGATIGFAREAKVYHRESSSLKQATTQRLRWSSGRFAIAWKYGFSLLLRGLIERSIVKFDAALPLIFPNPSLAINITVIGLATSLVLPVVQQRFLIAWFFTLGLIQTGIFVTGVFYTRNKVSKFMSIFIAPAFLLWKMGIDTLAALGTGRRKWTRTERKL